MVFTSSCPRVEAYATPYVIGRRLAAVKGFGTMPFTIRPRITDTTGSDALMTVVLKIRKIRCVFEDGISLSMRHENYSTRCYASIRA